MSISSYHGVPHVSVGVLNLGEKKVRVANVAGVGDGAESQDPARRKGVGDESRASHVRLDLPQLEHGGARLHGFQSWVCDNDVGF